MFLEITRRARQHDEIYVMSSTVGHKSPISRVEGVHPPKSGGLFMRGSTRTIFWTAQGNRVLKLKFVHCLSTSTG